MNDAAARLAVIGGAVPVDLGGAILVESWSNDTWMTGRFVLRVCWRGDRERLLRERALLASLPASVPHAVALTAGRAGDLTWLVLERLAGERLDLAWPRLTGRLRQEAVISLGTALGALHQVGAAGRSPRDARGRAPPPRAAGHPGGRPRVRFGDPTLA